MSSKKSHTKSSKTTSKPSRKKWIIIKWTKPSTICFWRRTLFCLISSKESTEKVILKWILFKKVSKNIFCIMEVKLMSSKSWSTLRFRSFMAILIIIFSFFFIREYFIGLWDLSKLLFSLLTIIKIFIRMPFNSKFSVSFFNLLIVGVLFDSKNFIETCFEWHFFLSTQFLKVSL